MAKKLSEPEINKRLVRLTNLERLHAQDQQTKAELRARIKQLESERAKDKAYFQGLSNFMCKPPLSARQC